MTDSAGKKQKGALCNTEFSVSGGAHGATRRDLAALAATVLAMAALPLLGLRGTPGLLARYGELPPLTQYVEHAPFAWWAFVLLAVPALLLAGFLAWCWIQVPRLPPRDPARGQWPMWGWWGLGLMGVCWGVAWCPAAILAPLRRYSFTPLWFSYIVLVNAWVMRRSGRCPMTAHPGRFAALFGASALFWWSFEYLNRFVQNWHYLGVEEMSAWCYVLHASAPFATVLPAVLSTEALLETFPRFEPAFRRFPGLRPAHPRLVAWGSLVVAALGLLLLGRQPEWLFPMLWMAPVMLMASSQALLGRPHLFSPLADGNAARLARLALAALICGFFWEMWNMYSYPRWVYSVPFVNGFHVFEMPLLGFLGYLPFGFECGMISDLIWRRARVKHEH